MLAEFDNELPPAFGTLWGEVDETTVPPVPGQLGDWKNDTLGVTYSGQWVMK